MNRTIGFVGFGLMGTAMATRLMRAGYKLRVHNRTKEKTEALVSRGARWCETPGETARGAAIVCSMVADPEALARVSRGPNGILSGLRKGGVHIDLSTVSPQLTRNLAREYTRAGRIFLHAPVLGSTQEAAAGRLLIFVGGGEKGYRKAKPVLRLMGTKHWRFVKPEEASLVKLLCNFFIGGMICTLTQAIACTEKALIEPSILLDSIAHSRLNAPMYQTKGAKIIERNFTPRFFATHMLKDLSLFVQAARDLGVPVPLAETARETYRQADLMGLGGEDYSAVIKVIEAKTLNRV